MRYSGSASDFDSGTAAAERSARNRPPEGRVEMASKRYLEAIKRLLSAETYFRSRDKAEKREPKAAVPENKSQQ
jgi:hypothetical protein